MSYEKKIGIVFPGQGSQKVGMGQDLFETLAFAKEKADQANSFLNKPLSSLCINGPKETLTLTENAQPGLSSFLLFYLTFWSKTVSPQPLLRDAAWRTYGLLCK